MRGLKTSLPVLGIFVVLPGLLLADDAALREILNKAIERKGAVDRVEKSLAGSVTYKGTISVNGAALPIAGETTSQAGEQLRVTATVSIDGQDIKVVSVYNRNQGWLKINDNAVDLSPEQSADSKQSCYSYWVTKLVHLKDKAYKLSPFGDIEIGGRKAVGITVLRDGYRPINLFFDKETYQLVRSEMVVHDDQLGKDVSEETTYSEYKREDGFEYPTKAMMKRDGQFYADLQIESSKLIEKLEDSEFAMP